jgi:hypothetical protein
LGAAAIYGVKVPLGIFRLKKLDAYNEKYGLKR